MDDSENQMVAVLVAKLSPAGREVAGEIDRSAGLDMPPSDDVMLKIDALSNEDRTVLTRLLRLKAQGARADEQKAATGEAHMERLQVGIYRAAELEGLDPSTLTVDKARAILERHGERV